MDKKFALEDCHRQGKLFDVRSVQRNKIGIQDIDLSAITENDFVLFFTGVLGKAQYGTPEYFNYDLALSNEFIQRLIEKK